MAILISGTKYLNNSGKEKELDVSKEVIALCDSLPNPALDLFLRACQAGAVVNDWREVPENNLVLGDDYASICVVVAKNKVALKPQQKLMPLKKDEELYIVLRLSE